MKTDEMEPARLVIPAGKNIPEQKVTEPIIVHCINGEIECTAMGKAQILLPSQLLYLMPDEPHLVKAIADSVVLLTIIFKI